MARTGLLVGACDLNQTLERARSIADALAADAQRPVAAGPADPSRIEIKRQEDPGEALVMAAAKPTFRWDDFMGYGYTSTPMSEPGRRQVKGAVWKGGRR